jgi:(2R)-sulfolactate sulfo-lyase subunit beta
VKQLTMSTKCGESDTTSGLASNPTVGRAFERLADAGATMIFGETTEVTGGEDISCSVATPEIAAQFQAAFDDYQRPARRFFGLQPPRAISAAADESGKGVSATFKKPTLQDH